MLRLYFLWSLLLLTAIPNVRAVENNVTLVAGSSSNITFNGAGWEAGGHWTGLDPENEPCSSPAGMYTSARNTGVSVTILFQGTAIYFVGWNNSRDAYYVPHLDGDTETIFFASASKAPQYCNVVQYQRTGLLNTQHNLTMSWSGAAWQNFGNITSQMAISGVIITTEESELPLSSTPIVPSSVATPSTTDADGAVTPIVGESTSTTPTSVSSINVIAFSTTGSNIVSPESTTSTVVIPRPSTSTPVASTTISALSTTDPSIASSTSGQVPVAPVPTSATGSSSNSTQSAVPSATPSSITVSSPSIMTAGPTVASSAEGSSVVSRTSGQGRVAPVPTSATESSSSDSAQPTAISQPPSSSLAVSITTAGPNVTSSGSSEVLTRTRLQGQAAPAPSSATASSSNSTQSAVLSTTASSSIAVSILSTMTAGPTSSAEGGSVVSRTRLQGQAAPVPTSAARSSSDPAQPVVSSTAASSSTATSSAEGSSVLSTTTRRVQGQAAPVPSSAVASSSNSILSTVPSAAVSSSIAVSNPSTMTAGSNVTSSAEGSSVLSTTTRRVQGQVAPVSTSATGSSSSDPAQLTVPSAVLIPSTITAGQTVTSSAEGSSVLQKAQSGQSTVLPLAIGSTSTPALPTSSTTNLNGIAPSAVNDNPGDPADLQDLESAYNSLLSLLSSVLFPPSSMAASVSRTAAPSSSSFPPTGANASPPIDTQTRSASIMLSPSPNLPPSTSVTPTVIDEGSSSPNSHPISLPVLPTSDNDERPVLPTPDNSVTPVSSTTPEATAFLRTSQRNSPHKGTIVGSVVGAILGLAAIIAFASLANWLHKIREAKKAKKPGSSKAKGREFNFVVPPPYIKSQGKSPHSYQITLTLTPVDIEENYTYQEVVWQRFAVAESSNTSKTRRFTARLDYDRAFGTANIRTGGDAINGVAFSDEPKCFEHAKPGRPIPFRGYAWANPLQFMARNYTRIMARNEDHVPLRLVIGSYVRQEDRHREYDSDYRTLEEGSRAYGTRRGRHSSRSLSWMTRLARASKSQLAST